MTTHGFTRMLRAALAVAAVATLPLSARAQAKDGRIAVAVAETDLEPIVRAVGGGQVETVPLFRGCILRKNLQVEPAARGRLAASEAIIWTGFLRESAAISSALRGAEAGPATRGKAKWIDVSRGAARTNLPLSTCFGFVDMAFADGDPFFWLNPANGGVIARNVAKGLGELRPASRAQFMANAEAFQKALGGDIARWKAALKPLHGMRIFSAQCGWQNFSAMGGPEFVVCKGTPGELPTPQALLRHIRQMKADLILVDPNTPPEYAEYFREHAGIKVVEIPSTLEGIPGGTTYGALFEHLVKVLQSQAKH